MTTHKHRTKVKEISFYLSNWLRLAPYHPFEVDIEYYYEAPTKGSEFEPPSPEEFYITSVHCTEFACFLGAEDLEVQLGIRSSFNLIDIMGGADIENLKRQIKDEIKDILS